MRICLSSSEKDRLEDVHESSQNRELSHKICLKPDRG